MSASAPEASRASRYGGKAAISAWLMSVFTVTYAFTPALCAKATADGMSSSVKFSARWRMPNLSAAKYTASAPKRTAASSWLRPPAGARSSVVEKSVISSNLRSNRSSTNTKAAARLEPIQPDAARQVQHLLPKARQNVSCVRPDRAQPFGHARKVENGNEAAQRPATSVLAYLPSEGS